MTTKIPQDESGDFFNSLRELIAACGPETNKHDKAIVLISACILKGWNTRPIIVGTLKALGFNPRHVAMNVNEGTGNNPALHRWRLDGDGHYILHDEEPAE